MLKSLILKNFQGHKRFKVKFDKRITCFVGPSDVGKSSIIRALKWIAFNKPNHKRMIRNGSKQASAIIHFDGRTIIERRRSRGSENSYYVNGDPLRAFGSECPDTVSKLLKLGPANFQSQHDSAFWLSENPSTVSKELNRIAGLESSDKALNLIGKEVRTAKQAVAFNRERYIASKSRKEALKTGPVCLSDGKKLLRLLKQWEEADRTISKLEYGISRIEQAEARLKPRHHSRIAAQLVRAIERIDAIDRRIDNLQSAEDRIATLLHSIKQQRARVCQAKRNQKRLKKLIGTLAKRCPKCGQVIVNQ